MTVEREMLLVTITARSAGSAADHVTELVASFDATVVDQDGDQMTVMLAGTPSRIDDFGSSVRPLGITELQRTGLVALPKLSPGAPAGP